MEVDVRSLILLRQGLALLLLYDLIQRWGEVDRVEAWSTREHIDLVEIDLYQIHGRTLLEYMMGVAFAFGWGWCWGISAPVVKGLLYISIQVLHARYPLVNNFGDQYMRVMSFWLFFLPMDAKRNGKKCTIKGYFVHLAILQVSMVYMVSGFLKLCGSEWREGVAINRVLQMDHYTSSLGEWFGKKTDLMLFSLLNPYAEMFLGALLLSPTPFIRMCSALALAIFHFGTAIMLNLGLLPLQFMIFLLFFVTPEVFDRLEERYGGLLFTSASTLHGQAQNPKFSRASFMLTTCIMSLVVLSNLSQCYEFVTGNQAAFHQPCAEILLTVGVHQFWGMFAPDPPPNFEPLTTIAFLKNGSVTSFTSKSGDIVSVDPTKEESATAIVESIRLSKDVPSSRVQTMLMQVYQSLYESVESAHKTEHARPLPSYVAVFLQGHCIGSAAMYLKIYATQHEPPITIACQNIIHQSSEVAFKKLQDSIFQVSETIHQKII